MSATNLIFTITMLTFRPFGIDEGQKHPALLDGLDDLVSVRVAPRQRLRADPHSEAYFAQFTSNVDSGSPS